MRKCLCRHLKINFRWVYFLVFMTLVTLTILANVLLETVVMDEIVGMPEKLSNRSTSNVKDIPIPYSFYQSYLDDDVKFFLYTRSHAGYELRVNNTASNLNASDFQPRDPTKIIIHGYNSDMNLVYLVDMRREYLQQAAYNIIFVDWHKLAATPYYPNAVHHVPYVGQCLARLIIKLHDVKNLDIHIIGFSLGAHVPAYSAQILPFKVPRITGLDPALPFFITSSKSRKLDPSDAEFVDAIHTNAFIQGQFRKSGHIDFYMNGGIYQPGCWKDLFKCNHHRALEYFVESINTKVGFYGWRCTGFVGYMLGHCPPKLPAVKAGNNVDKRYRGFYLVKTKDNKPFALGLLPFIR